MEICAFLGLVGHYWGFINGFAQIVQPLNEHQAGEGPSRKSEWVSLLEDALGGFQALTQASMSAPILAFADYTKELLLETDASRRDWEQYFPQNRNMGDTIQ